MQEEDELSPVISYVSGLIRHSCSLNPCKQSQEMFGSVIGRNGLSDSLNCEALCRSTQSYCATTEKAMICHCVLAGGCTSSRQPVHHSALRLRFWNLFKSAQRHYRPSVVNVSSINATQFRDESRWCCDITQQNPGLQSDLVHRTD